MAVTIAAPLEKEIRDWDEYAGRFRAVERVEVRARVSGYLEEIQFEDGQMVEAGQVLFVIDQRPFKIAMEQAEADIGQANAQLELARKEFERVRSLRESRAVSAEELDRRTQELAVAKARVKALEAKLNSAKLDMEFTEVKAPISGRISENYVTKGNLITGGSAGTTLLTTIVSLDPIYFDLEATEGQLLTYIRADNQGDRQSSRDEKNAVYVKLLDEEDYTHEGYIDFVDNEVNIATGTMQARAIFQNSDGLIEPGIFGRARIAGSKPYKAIVVPDSAIGTNQTMKFVLVIGEGNVASVRPVELGTLQEGGLRVIRSGLGPNDKIIINGLARIRPGMPVQPEETTIEQFLEASQAPSAP
jgi:RND family efflux transporter MFP subunit